MRYIKLTVIICILSFSNKLKAQDVFKYGKILFTRDSTFGTISDKKGLLNFDQKFNGVYNIEDDNLSEPLNLTVFTKGDSSFIFENRTPKHIYSLINFKHTAFVKQGIKFLIDNQVAIYTPKFGLKFLPYTEIIDTNNFLFGIRNDSSFALDPVTLFEQYKTLGRFKQQIGNNVLFRTQNGGLILTNNVGKSIFNSTFDTLFYYDSINHFFAVKKNGEILLAQNSTQMKTVPVKNFDKRGINLILYPFNLFVIYHNHQIIDSIWADSVQLLNKYVLLVNRNDKKFLHSIEEDIEISVDYEQLKIEAFGKDHQYLKLESAEHLTLIDSSLKPILTCEPSSKVSFVNNRMVLNIGKQFIIDNRITISADKLIQLLPSLYALIIADKWYLSDTHGYHLNHFGFDSLSVFNGKILAFRNHKLGLLATDGTWILPPIYSKIIPSPKLTFVKKPNANRFDLLDSAGNEMGITADSVDYDKNSSFIVFRNADLFGLINQNGEIAFPNIFNGIKLFSPPFFYFRHKMGHGIGHFDGKICLLDTGRYNKILPECERLFPIEVNKQWGYIDSAGRVIIAYQYDTVFGFNNGYSKFKMSTGLGIYNRYEKYIVQPFAQDAQQLNPFLFSFKKNNKWGVVDSVGKILLDSEYDSLFVIGNFLIAMRNNSSFILHYKTTLPITPLKINSFTLISESEMLIENSEGNLVINQEGDIRLPFSKDITTYYNGKIIRQVLGLPYTYQLN